MIGEKIQQLRKQQGLSQSSLAEKIGLTRRIISTIEREENKPTLEQATMLSNFFNVSLDYIAKGDDSPINDKEREIIKAVRNDDSLLSSLMKIIESRKHLETLAI